MNAAANNVDEKSKFQMPKHIIPEFILSETCKPGTACAHCRQLTVEPACPPVVYHYRPLDADINRTDHDAHIYRHMPVVLDRNKVPWYEACLYILCQIESKSVPKMATYDCLADDLTAYKQYLDAEQIDFKIFQKRKMHRPTYRYRGYLEHLIQTQVIAPTTARRRMGSVIKFYRWLREEEFIHPEFTMWEEKELFISFKDSKGFSLSKPVKTTDVSVKVSQVSDPYSGAIDDGGKLRPLSPMEQDWLISALSEADNIRMTLIHYISMFTGARLQTALTFKVRHVMPEILASECIDIPIPVGPGTGIDTKGSRKSVLYMPRWLYDKLRIYAGSERAQILRERAGGNSPDQYLFLTDRGRPFYQSDNDKSNSTKRQVYGQSVREYIRKYLIPKVRRLSGNPGWHYRFHDLRASYGMNLTDSQLSLVQESKLTLHQAREFVKTRMGHKSSSTTDLYLQYRGRLGMVRQVQATYEAHLASLARKAIEGDLLSTGL